MVTPEFPLDLQPIVFGFDRETATVDYKAGIGWNELNRRGRMELFKDLMAFGNSDSIGYVVVGVSEAGSGRYERTGVTEQQAKSYDPTPVGVDVRTFSDPEVQFTIHTPELRGKLFVIFRTIPFATVPHICKRSYPGILDQAAIYVRTDNAQTMKVPTAEHMRRLVERAMVNQGDRLLAQIRSLVGPGAAAPPPSSPTQQFRDQISRLLGRGS